MSSNPWIQLIRLPAGASAVSNVVAAHVVSVGEDHQLISLALAIACSLFLYYGGMILNDCFDYSEDAQDRPYRVLPSGSISLQQAWSVGLFCLLFSFPLAASINIRSLLIAVGLALAIVLYNSKIFSEWYGAIVMGVCRYANWMLGLAVVGLSWTSLSIALPVFVYVVALSRLGQVETAGDWSSRRFEILALLVATIVLLVVQSQWLFVSLFLTLSLGAYWLYILKPFKHSVTSSGELEEKVGRLIVGLIPLDSAIVFGSGHVGAACYLILLLPLSQFFAKKISIS